MSQLDQLDHYQLVKGDDGALLELGRGAMGVTYKAFDVNLKCFVALKVINASYLSDPTSAERFLREARAAAQLRHAHVASVFHLGRHGESYFYAMEFIDGETVDARVKREGPLKLKAALTIVDQVASALVAAEKRNLVHRDIKPANLMLAHEMEGEISAKLIDFGLVKSVGFGVQASLTATGFVGTPYFASPEQLDQGTEDVRSDIYSLGATLWLMLTGQPPFLGSIASVISQHLSVAPPFASLVAVPPCLVRLLDGMLAKDPAQRIQTPAHLRVQVRRCLKEVGGFETNPPFVAQTPAAPTAPSDLSSSARPQTRPTVGAVLEGKFRLVKDIDPANPNRNFRADDLERSSPVRIKIFRITTQNGTDLQSDFKKLQGVNHPGFLQVTAVTRLQLPWDGLLLIVLEWCEAFSLAELLRTRKKLALSEIAVLLEQIAPAMDLAHRLGVILQMSSEEILLTGPGSDFNALSRPLLLSNDSAIAVKMNPLGRVEDLESSATWTGGITQIGGPEIRADLTQLGLLVTEWMGPIEPGADSFLDSILHLCRTAGENFHNADEFLLKFRQVAASEKTPAQSHSSGKTSLRNSSVLAPARTTGESTQRPEHSTAGKSGTPTPAPRGNRVYWLAALGLTSAIALGMLWVFWRPAPPLPKAIVSVVPAIAKASSRPPPQMGKSWLNSLEMPFAPLGDAHMSVFKVRVRDFSAFVAASNYDAEGGMYSWQSDGFKEHRHSWKNPGFAQTPEHPVVGVSWEDANKFCEWLTQKEQGEATLSSEQAYRLPTDREWDTAVGLPLDNYSTPEERSGKVKGVYPWGKTFPPIQEECNYAGAESKVNVPESWLTIPNYRDSFARTRPSTNLKPNAQGLCDLGGDAWEWCDDRYNTRMNWRVLRGGSWSTAREEEMLSSFRQKYDPNFRHDDVGFRCVLVNRNDKR